MADVKIFEFTVPEARATAEEMGITDTNVLAILEDFATTSEGMGHGDATVHVYRDEQVLEIIIRARVWPTTQKE